MRRPEGHFIIRRGGIEHLFMVLESIEKEGGAEAKQAQVLLHTTLRSSTFAKIIDKLAENGLIEVNISYHGISTRKRLSLTKEGKALLQKWKHLKLYLL
ncbi:MAG: hypothetical protein QG670_2748 [Thermoproteota archaeon]|nr:hypothetical protein [Thermoproteota archaeon]